MNEERFWLLSIEEFPHQEESYFQQFTTWKIDYIYSFFFREH